MRFFYPKRAYGQYCGCVLILKGCFYLSKIVFLHFKDVFSLYFCDVLNFFITFGWIFLQKFQLLDLEHVSSISQIGSVKHLFECNRTNKTIY